MITVLIGFSIFVILAWLVLVLGALLIGAVVWAWRHSDTVVWPDAESFTGHGNVIDFTNREARRALRIGGTRGREK